jgi:hypothetical protein
MHQFRLSAVLGLILGILAVTAETVGAAPVVSGFAVSQYASVVDPTMMTFAPDGAMYVGRDSTGSGAGFGDAVKIHRVAPGGGSVAEYGTTAIGDPDSVLFDATGAFSGVANSVLVGGGGTGIVAIRPDQTIVTILTPSDINGDVDTMAFDPSGGTLIFSGSASARVSQTSGGAPSQLIATTNGVPTGLAVSSSGDVFIGTYTGNVDRFNSSGAPITMLYASGLGSVLRIAIGHGGAFGDDLFAINNDGNLYRVDDDGIASLFGTGFASFVGAGIGDFLAFGPDGSLYVSEHSTDTIWRITAAVPEPGGMALALLALVALAASRHAPARSVVDQFSQ